MRKKLAIILVIILLLSTICGVTLCYNDGNETPAKDISPIVITPTSNYMQLSSPRLVAYAGDIMIAANSKSLFINKGNGIYKTIIDSDSPNEILQMAATDKYIILLISDKKDEIYLKLYSIDNAELVRDISFLFPNQPKQISSDKDNIYIVDYSNVLFKMNDNALDDPLTTINLTPQQVTGDLIDVHNNIIYIYRDAPTNSIYQYTFNADTNNYVKQEIINGVENITTMSVTNTGIHYVEGNTKLVYYSLLNGTSTHTASITNINSIATKDNITICATPKDNRVMIFNLTADNNINNSGYFGDKGSELDRLNRPVGVAISDNKIIVADSANNRIIATDKISLQRSVILNNMDYTVTNIAAKGDKLITLDQNKILRLYKINNDLLEPLGNVALTSYGSINDMDITSDGTAYLLINNSNVIKVVNDNISQLYSLNNIQSIALSKDNYLYLATPTELVRYNISSNDVDNRFAIADSDVQDIIIDLAGNAYYFKGNIMTRYQRVNMNYTLSNNYNILNTVGNNEELSITFDSSVGDCYITNASAHNLVKINSADISSMSENNMNFVHTPPEQWDVISVGKINADTYLLSAPNNDEAITKVTALSIFLTLDQIIYNEQSYYYGVLSDRGSAYYYIPTDKVTILPRTNYPIGHQPMSPIYNIGANIYAFPYYSASVLINVPKGDEIQLIDNVGYNSGAHIWKWYKVSYKSSDGTIITGYADASDIYYSGYSTPPKNKKYLKINSEKFGVPVAMYSEPSDTSTAIFDNLTDGTRIMLAQDTFDTTSEYTRVTYDNATGYIKTVYLQQEGLTKNQELAIIISSVCLGILAIILLLIILMKKIKKIKPKDNLAEYDGSYVNNEHE